jgi:hypothetical protein
VLIRKFQPADRERIREICQATALRGKNVKMFFEDGEIVSRLFADYYLDYEPDSCFVADVDGRVLGYALACKDTKKFMRVAASRIVPRVIGRILWKIVTAQYRSKQTYKTLWWVLTRSWREIPSASIDDYPAHIHVSVDPELAEMKLAVMKLGMRLGQTVIEHLRQAGVRGIHGSIAEEEGDDNLSRFYCHFYGARITEIKRFSLWETLTAKRWYAKLMLIEL